MRSTINGVAFCISARALDHDRGINSPHLNPGPYKLGSVRIDQVSALWLHHAVRNQTQGVFIPSEASSPFAHLLLLGCRTGLLAAFRTGTST